MQREDRKGRTSAAGLFLDEAPRYKGWALAFLDALHNNGMGDLAKKLCEGMLCAVVFVCGVLKRAD